MINSLSAVTTVEAGIRAAVRSWGYFHSESEFQEALCRELGGLPRCERERPVQFGPPLYAAPEPPSAHQPAKDVCQKRGSRKLDLLLRLGSEFVAIELKYGRIPDWLGTYNGSPIPVVTPADVLTYYFLKDIHRLERLIEVRSGSGPVFPQHRICAFLTNYPYDFEGQTIHSRIRLLSGTLRPGHLVQYNLKTHTGKDTSANTLWRDYPPFRLGGTYQVEWRDMNNDVSTFIPAPGESRLYPNYKLLLVEVRYVPT